MTHTTRTPEQNLAARMAHVTRMTAMVEELTEEGTKGRIDLMAHVENLSREVLAVYRAEKEDAIRTNKAYMHHARVEPLPEDGPVYQRTHEGSLLVLSGDHIDTHQPHPSWEGRLPEMEDSFTERLPNVQPGFFRRAANFVKGLFA
ncbi:hypothetical protein V8O11_22230 [Erwinia aphidicola]|uniref:hypothetical protein n=1 Tax=Erwinia aphidicola TaxID=68334 RepID=UPI00300C9D83